LNFPLSLRALAALVAGAAVATALVAPVTAPAKPKRPSVKVVKRVVAKHWDTDGPGARSTTLRFRDVKRGKVRRRKATERAPAQWVTPVTVKFRQTITEGRDRNVALITERALFYKGASGWRYFSKHARIEYVE
jgi:hypothetical protein